MIRGQSKSRPPKGDVYAVHEWDEAHRRWVSRLNPAGEAAFNQIMADYGGAPVKMLVTVSRRTLVRASRHPDQNGVHQAAALGVWKGVIRFTASRGFQLSTCVGYSVWAEVSEFLNTRIKREQREDNHIHPDGCTDFGVGPDSINWQCLDDRRVKTPDVQLEQQEDLRQLPNLLDQLKPLWRAVVVGRYFERRSFADIGREIGVSRSRVQQIEVEAIKVMRDLAAGRKLTRTPKCR